MFTASSEAQIDRFMEKSAENRATELGKIKIKEKAKRKKILEAHLRDNTLQPLNQFEKIGEKEVGVSSGFLVRQGTKSSAPHFMVKSTVNHTLTKEEQRTRLQQFEASFFKTSREVAKQFLPSMNDGTISAQWRMVEKNLCYDDLNVADFIREYIAGDLYRYLLQDKAPIIELITDRDLPEKRFIKTDTGYRDRFKEHFEQEKGSDQLYLRSKFLNKFSTLLQLKKTGTRYESVEGFEKILAAQMLLGEGDIFQPENFGVMETGVENKIQHWAKIDHGRSLYSTVSHWKQILMFDFDATFGIKMDYRVFAQELSTYVRMLSENKEFIDRLIAKRVYHLHQILNPKMEFTLRYVVKNVPSAFRKEVFRYSDKSKTFVSNKGNTLEDYFKNRLQNQIKVMERYAEILTVTSRISEDFQQIAAFLPLSFMFSMYKDPLVWAIQKNKALDSKDPIVWAIEEKRKLNGKYHPIAWSIFNSKKIESKSPAQWAEEHQFLIDGKAPAVFANTVWIINFISNTVLLAAAVAAATAYIGFFATELMGLVIISATVFALAAVSYFILSHFAAQFVENRSVSKIEHDDEVDSKSMLSM